MNAHAKHPPADRRCQLYVRDDFTGQLARCINQGNHWVHWGGCDCGDESNSFCEAEFESWECGGPCIPEFLEAA